MRFVLLQVPAVRLGGVCEGVQHLHRGVHPRPAGTHRPGDRCGAQTLQPSAGTVSSPHQSVNGDGESAAQANTHTSGVSSR